MKPITPDEVKIKKAENISPHMVEAVNNMIIKNWDGYCANFKKKDLITEYFNVVGINKTQKRVERLYEEQQLDFEPLFEEAGWEVEYDRPAYNETYDSNFIFEKRKTKT